MQGSLRWLFIPGEPELKFDDTGHGTCVTSKVASPAFGTAKSANIVVVKVGAINGRVSGSRLMAAWGTVAHDIASKNMQGRAVVSISMGGELSRS